jgi:elongation factor P
MASTTADIHNGMCFRMDSHIWKIIEFLHVKPGKGPAFVRTKIKNLNNLRGPSLIDGGGRPSLWKFGIRSSKVGSERKYLLC